jgi:DNA-binding MarR family transcriptional regulator
MRTDNLIAFASALRYHAVEYLAAELRARGIDDLIPSQGALLSMLYGRRGRATMKELVQASRRNKSTMTEMAKALERRGYLVRERDPEDARGVVLVLTPKAWGTRHAFDRISEQLLAAAWGDMPQEKRETLTGLLMEVVGNLADAHEMAQPAGAAPGS